MKPQYGANCLLLYICLVRAIEAGIDGTGLCALYTFVPFTDNGTSSSSFILRGNESSNIGYDHMAAGLLAMQHFNERNTSVVPELANLTDCPIRFDMNHSRFFDSDTRTHLAVQTLVQEPRIPCAIAGAFHDMPSLDLAAQAMAQQYAHVAYQAFNLRISSEKFAPFTSQVSPSMTELARRTVEYMLFWNRTNFTAVLYPTTDLGIQERELLSMELSRRRIMYQSEGFYDPYSVFADQPASDTLRALHAVKERGYRTLIVALDDSRAEVPSLARAAEEAGLNNGDYFWIWFGQFDPKLLDHPDPLVTKLLYGSVLINAVELYLFRSFYNFTDPFAEAIGSIDATFMDQLNAMNPMVPGEPGYVNGPPDFFQNLTRVEMGSGFLYDSIMSIGIGACLAQQQHGLPLDGRQHRDGIRRSNFSGASGRVEFDRRSNMPGVRNSTTISYGALNLLPSRDTSFNWGANNNVFTVVGIRPSARGFQDRWVSVANFTFADGRNVPPDLLRTLPNQNYLMPELRGFALFLAGTVYLASIVTVGWVFLHREHRVVKAAQPTFLYILACGAAVMGSTIVCLVNDESYGWTESQLSKGCASVVWLVSLGCIIQYLALFSKLWRVHRVLQFQRHRINLIDVIWPAALLMTATMAILISWTIVDPPYWARVEIDPVSGDSIGLCETYGMQPFIIPLAILMLLPIFLTGYMAWKTKDVDDAYTESWWIFILFCVQLEILVVGAPLVAILRDVSTNGKIMGYAILFWTLPMTALGLIMIPKYLAYWRAVHHLPTPTKSRGRQAGNVYVSGLDERTATVSALPTQSCAATSEGTPPAPRVRLPCCHGGGSPSNLTVGERP